MFPFGPFPFVGAVIICVIKAICIFVGNLKQGNGLRAVKDIFTLQNIFAMLSVAPVYILYYTSNSIISNSAVVSGEHVETSFRIHDTLKTIVEENDIKNFLIFWLIYLLFILLEVGVYFIPVMIGNRRKPKDMTFILSCASLLLIPLFQVGVAGDFAMRVSIPALTYLCITFIRMVMERIPEKGKSKNFDEFVRKNALLCVSVFIFLIGTTTPIIEIEREAINTAFYGVHSEDETILESLEDNEEKNNFAAANYTESTFYKYLCKH
jgi:hypothetical protein